jgi:hypothetical protein
MSQETDRPDANAAGDVPPESQTDDSTRRQFIRRSAEVAAFSLFGVAEVEGLLERIATEVGRLRGDARMATEAAEVLSEAGLTTMASAQCVSWEQECRDAGAYDPDCVRPDPHDCGKVYHKFRPFPCGGEVWYDCYSRTSPNYAADCKFITPYSLYCGTDQSVPNEFSEQCQQYLMYGNQCLGANENYQCVRYVCDAFPGLVFDCSSESGSSFTCEPSEYHGFQCSGSDGLADFRCFRTFGCAGSGDQFDCYAAHLFQCWRDFECNAGPTGPQEPGFTCSGGGAGTIQCNTSNTGRYAYDDPGDFHCVSTPGVGVAFDCRGTALRGFYCTGVADDFACGDTASPTMSFQCTSTSPFSADGQCPEGPQQGHLFQCGPGNFHCQPQGAYTCQNQQYYG